jgi:hypothetical protein
LESILLIIDRFSAALHSAPHSTPLIATAGKLDMDRTERRLLLRGKLPYSPKEDRM